MARLAISITVFLFVFTFSHARDLQTRFPEPESEPKREQHDTVSLSLDSIDPVPLTILSFRPIDRRHFHNRHPMPLSLRGCRHSRQIHYGNDAIVLSDASGEARRPFTRLPEMMDRRDVHHYRRHVRGEQHHHHHLWFGEKVRELMNLF